MKESDKLEVSYFESQNTVNVPLNQSSNIGSLRNETDDKNKGEKDGINRIKKKKNRDQSDEGEINNFKNKKGADNEVTWEYPINISQTSKKNVNNEKTATSKRDEIKQNQSNSKADKNLSKKGKNLEKKAVGETRNDSKLENNVVSQEKIKDKPKEEGKKSEDTKSNLKKENASQENDKTKFQTAGKNSDGMKKNNSKSNNTEETINKGKASGANNQSKVKGYSQNSNPKAEPDKNKFFDKKNKFSVLI